MDKERIAQGKITAFEWSPETKEKRLSETILDPTMLAHAIGIQLATLWWLVLYNKRTPTKNTKPGERILSGGSKFYKHMTIPKGGGKVRHIHEPHPVLKNVQKSLLVTFFAQHTAPAHVSAYIKNRSIRDAAAQHVGNPVKISLDIKDFFPSVTKAMIVSHLVDEMGFREDIAKMIARLTTIPVPRRRRADDTVYVLPQGAPTSAALSNRIAMRRLDDPVLDYLKPYDAVYTRYCDNLEISFHEDQSRETVDQIIRDVKKLIRNAGWYPNHKKTKVQRRTSPKIPMRVLGINTQDKLSAPKKVYRRLRMIVYLINTYGYTQELAAGPLCAHYAAHNNPEAIFDHVHGEIQFWKTIQPDKFDPLLQRLLQGKGET